MSSKNTRPGFTIGDGFRLGLGFAIANAFIALLCAAIWTFALAGLFGAAALRNG